MGKASEVKRQLQFDVERLRQAAHRLEAIDLALTHLKSRLEARAHSLATRAMAAERQDAPVQLARAQAQATATLAQRAVLAAVVQGSPLSLIAGTALNRWVSALRRLGSHPLEQSALRAHVEAGRLAHRLLAVFRPRAGLKGGVGQLVASVVVAELVASTNTRPADELIEEGLARAMTASGVRSEADAIAAASRALRAAAELLESMAQAGEPAVSALLTEAEGVESKVAGDLSRGSDRLFGRK